MSLKRKFDKDTVSESDRSSKQLRLVPFPTYEADTDIAMSDDALPSVSLDTVIPEPHHMRLDSGASTASSDCGDATAYPSFNFYPNPFFGSDGSVDTESHSFSRQSTSPPPRKTVGLLEPKNSFLHHGNCTQIPKLRVACASSSHGQRSMWSHCEQCGAIEMIDPDY